MALIAQLYPDVGLKGEYDPGLWGPMVGPLRMRIVTVRQVLNRLVRDAGQAAWVVQVPPREMGQLPSSGLWLSIEYSDPLRMGRVAQLILTARHPVGKLHPDSDTKEKP